MTPDTAPTALAAAPVTVEQIVTIVDELAIASAPSPRAKILRTGLITDLRAEMAPSIGSTGTGRGGARIPIDVGMLTLWEDVTGRIESLYDDILGESPITGSHEQILLAWSRELLVAHTEAPHGLNQDALILALRKVTRIRDIIRDHFDPPRTGDIPGIACEWCAATRAEVDRDGEIEVMPALGWSSSRRTGLVVTCRACGAEFDQEYLTAKEGVKWAARLAQLDVPLSPAEWTRLRAELADRTRPLPEISVWELINGGNFAYVVCNRLLNPETNEHCEYDGRVPISDRGYGRCPGCRGRVYPENTNT
ncbi:hypothetical protein ACYX8G_19575 [Microbacterium saperdae]